MRTYLILILIAVIFVSCKKENDNNNITSISSVYDTIYPLSYFPAFPGSYWIYSNDDTLKIEDNYELYYYDKSYFDQAPDYDTVYLPKFKINSIFNSSSPDEKYIHVYKYEIENFSYRLLFRSIMSETLGNRFPVAENFGGHSPYAITTTVDTSMQIENNYYPKVLIVSYYTEPTDTNSHVFPYRHDYFAKNIGLIMRDHKYYQDTAFITDYTLTSYMINS